MNILQLFLIPLMLSATLCDSGQASATTAVSVTDEEPDAAGNPSYTLGFSFSLAKSASIYALGIYDSGNDGLADAYPIGVWNSSGDLVASATLGLETPNILVDKFRFMSIAPVTLEAGSYRIGALYSTSHDKLVFSGLPGEITNAPGVTYLGSAYVAGGALSNPIHNAGMNGYLGPNFQFQMAAVPEPSTWMLMIGGFGMVGARCAAVRRREPGSPRVAA